MTLSNISPEIATALQAYVNALQDRFGGQLVNVWLFGSQARGEASVGSDIDVIVILDHPDENDLNEVRGLAFDI